MTHSLDFVSVNIRCEENCKSKVGLRNEVGNVAHLTISTYSTNHSDSWLASYLYDFLVRVWKIKVRSNIVSIGISCMLI